VPDIEDVLSRTKPARRSVPICLDGSIAERVDGLERVWLDAVKYDREHNAPDTAPAIRDQIEALRAEADAATIEFTVEALGSTAWRRLVAEHPPPDDDLEGWRWDPVSFPPVAVAASCLDPKMSEDQAYALADRLSDGQWGKLFGAVLHVNVGDDIPKFALGTDDPPTSEPRSTTAPHEGSLTESSSASGDSLAPAN
jgi:hypothetical protein